MLELLREKNLVEEKQEEADNSLKDNLHNKTYDRSKQMNNKLVLANKIFNPITNTILAIIIAFVFSSGIRLFWPTYAQNIEQFKYNGELMLTTNDGYYFAEGARDLINGFNKNGTLEGDSESGDLSPVKDGFAEFTAFIAYVAPFSFESVIFYLPTFISSLIIIPIILLGRLLGSPFFGFLASILATSSIPYFNRTMSGYYDTDIVALIFPFFIIWALVASIKSQKYIYITILSFFSIIYTSVYQQGISLQVAIFGILFCYCAYEFYMQKHRVHKIHKNQLSESFIFSSHTLIIFIFSIAFGLIANYYNISILFPIISMALLSFFAIRHIKNFKQLLVLFCLGAILLIYSGAVDSIISRLELFVFRDSTFNGKEESFLQLHFFSVSQTIREAGVISFDTFASRTSSNIYIFIASIIGYLYLLFRHPLMIFTLPIIGLGFLAMFGGVRFAMYASPILAIGYAFFIIELFKLIFSKTNILSKINHKYSNYKKLITTSLVIICSLIASSFLLNGNIKHAQNYRVGPVFKKVEVEPIVKLGKIASREDYVVTWWDYGYPLRYYANMKTPSDGGKHEGDTNFPNSYSLTHKPALGAKMTRLNVEYIEKQFEYAKQLESNNETIVKQTKKLLKNKYGIPNYLDTTSMMTLDYGFLDVNDFLISLETDIELPKKTRDIYFYLPSRMINIFPVVKLFSYLDLMNGAKKPRGRFERYSNFKSKGNKIMLNANIYIDKVSGSLFYGNKKVLIKRFANVGIDKRGFPATNVQNIAKNSNVNVIFLRYPKMVLIVDDSYYESLYFQLGILGFYDKDLFEPVHIDPLTKIYKLKI
jgi:dolichyl-diphosphooligosaccharide--protein glycosyltransferase/undecaprenyl-diphosphooligosaccharide--protein glycosyltransferase